MIFICIENLLFAQRTAIDSSAPKEIHLSIRSLDKEDKFFQKLNIKKKWTLKNELEINSKLQLILRKLYADAFISASLDTLMKINDDYYAYFFVGESYNWARLNFGQINPDLLKACKIRTNQFEDQLFHYTELNKIQQSMLEYLENNGYPFAHTKLNNIKMKGTDITADLICDYGPFISYDALKIAYGKNKKNVEKKFIKKGFLSAYLGLKENKPYSEKQIQKLSRKIKALNYLDLNAAPFISFRDDKAEVNLSLGKRPSSKIDVLFGFIPQKNPINDQQEYNFTGNIDIDLINPFSTGKRIHFKWQQIKEGISDLVIDFEWPYILNTPIGLDFSFKLYKRDSSFIDIITDLGFQYLFNGNSYLKILWINTRTNLINIEEATIISNKRLPDRLDLDKSAFGLEFYYDNLDYRFNPMAGFETKISASFEIKNIRRNNRIEELRDPLDAGFNFSSLYDSLTLNAFQYHFQLMHRHFFKLWKWSSIMTKLDAAMIYSASDIYQNELFRIGGNQKLRGFDEESIFSSLYGIFTLEWRFLFSKNSFAYIFGDLAYYQDKSLNNNIEDVPVGFGVGVALETKVGIFGLSYALGHSNRNPISFNNSKVHFGYLYAF